MEKKRRKRDRGQELSKREKGVLNVSQNFIFVKSFRRVPIWYEDIYSIQFDNMIWIHLYKKKKKKTRRIPRPRASQRPSLPFFPFTYICGWQQQGKLFLSPSPPTMITAGGGRDRQFDPKQKKKEENIDWGRKIFRRAIFTSDKLLNTHTAFERNVLFRVIIACLYLYRSYSAQKFSKHNTCVAEKKENVFPRQFLWWSPISPFNKPGL